MLIDDITIKIAAGNGGKGAVAFNKNMMSQGPVGGDGGNGGNVVFEGIADLSALNKFRYKKEFRAQNGQDGKMQFNDGTTGEDLILKVPVGTVIHNLTTGQDHEIVKIGERYLSAKGGKGGKGNFKFRSPRDTSPTRFQPGLPGEEFNMRLELKLIADVGLIGLPNVGKSNLLNELTSAKSKVADYPFTTLEPNLGVYYGLVIADIPGLIEGASHGKGLGIKFLRHIERTKFIFHLLAADSPDPAKDYKTVRAELKAHSKELLEKPEYVFLSKSDNAGDDEIKKKISALKKLKINALPISILKPETLKEVKSILNRLEENKREKDIKDKK